MTQANPTPASAPVPDSNATGHYVLNPAFQSGHGRTLEVKDNGTTNRGQNASADALLPTEILISVLGLTRPSPSVAATCQATAKIVRSHHQRLSWTHFAVFHAALPTRMPQIGTRSSRHQCGSPLAKFLISRLPEEPPQVPDALADVEDEDEDEDEDEEDADERLVVPDEQLIPNTIEKPRVAMVAPLEPASDPLVTMHFFTWLFSPKGPLHLTKPFTSTEFASTLHSINDSKCNAESTSPASSLWSPLRDALQLLVHSFRTGNLDAASLIFPQLAQVIPADCLLPAKQWSFLLLENRTRVVLSLTQLGDESISFPTFCYWLAAVEWSLPLLKLVHAQFNDLSGLRNILTIEDVHDPDSFPLYNSIHSTFTTLDDPDRFMPVLKFLRDQGGVDFSLQCMLFIEYKKQHYLAYKALIEFFGWEILTSSDLYEMYGKRMSWIGGCMMTWEAEKGTTEHLEQIMEHGLYHESAASHAFQLALLHGHDNVVEVLVENLGDEVLSEILVQLLFEDQTFKHPPSARYFTALLAHYGRMLEYRAVRRTPTQLLLRALQKQSFQTPSYLFRLLFEATAPANAPWDFAMVLHAFIKPFVNTAPFNPASLDGNATDSDYFAFFRSAALLVQTPFVARTLMALHKTGKLDATLAKMDAAQRYTCTMTFFCGVGLSCSTESPETCALWNRSPLLEATASTLLARHPTSKHPTIARSGIRISGTPRRCPQDEYRLLSCARPSVLCLKWLLSLLALVDPELAVACVDWNKHTPTWAWAAVAHLLPQEDGETDLHFKVYSAAIKGMHRIAWVLESNEDEEAMVKAVPKWIQRYGEWRKVMRGEWEDSDEEEVDEEPEDGEAEEDEE